jgi:phosphoglucomutase
MVEHNKIKIYAESFRGADHLRRILEKAQTIVNDTLAAVPQQSGIPSEPNLKRKS